MQEWIIRLLIKQKIQQYLGTHVKIAPTEWEEKFVAESSGSTRVDKILIPVAIGILIFQWDIALSFQA
jgi:hypothetical protein